MPKPRPPDAFDNWNGTTGYRKPCEIERYRLLSAMYAFFSGAGVQKPVPAPIVKPRKLERVIKKGGGC